MDAALLSSLLVDPRGRPGSCECCPHHSSRPSPIRSARPRWSAIVEISSGQFCSFVVVDTPAYFNDVVLGLVEVSPTRCVLVAGMDIPNIKNVKIGLQTLRLLNTPMEKLLPGAQSLQLEGQARHR